MDNRLKSSNLSLRNCRVDRIDVEFKNKDFFEILKRWKSLCERYGGQTRRLEHLIKLDVENIKEDIKNGVDKI